MPNESGALRAQYLRLLTTLSSGAVILVATFLRDVFPKPTARILLTIGIGCFALCIVFSLRAFSWLAGSEAGRAALPEIPPKDIEAATHDKALPSFRWALRFFIAGISCLAAFVIWNLYA